MGKYLRNLKPFLSDKKVTTGILLFAIVNRIIQIIFFYNIRMDAAFQVMATKNFVKGNGISIGETALTDLSSQTFQPLINWPPGYSLMLSPFYILFDHNYIKAGITLDIIAAIILILFCRKILGLFSLPIYLINLFTILSSLFTYYFYFIASSDAITISFYLISIFFSLQLLKTNIFNWKTCCSIYLPLLIAGFLKYLFIPVIFVIPFFLMIKGKFDRNAIIWKAGLYLFLSLGFSIGLLLSYQKLISGSATYISSTGRGFFPENLKDIYPFIPTAFLRLDTISLFFKNPQVWQTVFYRLFQFIHLGLTGISIFFAISFIKKTRLKNIDLKTSFLIFILLVSLAITILLIILSLTVAKEEILPGWLWTYVEDARYYGLITILLQLAVFIFYPSIKTYRNLRIMFQLSIAFLFIEMCRGVIFDLNRLRFFSSEEYSWQYENRFQKYAASIIQQEQKKYGPFITVVTGSSLYMNIRVNLYSNATIMNEPEKINDFASFNTAKKVLLMVILHKRDFAKYKPFLAAHANDVAGKFDDFYFYTTYVNPH